MKTAGICSLVVLFALALVGGGTAASSGCNDPAGCITVNPGKALEVGTLLADFFPDATNAVQIAVDLRGGTLAGHPLQVVRSSEGNCEDEPTQTGAQELSGRSAMVGVIGTICSPDAFMAAPILGNTMMVSPANTAPSLTLPGSHPANFARVVGDDRQLGIAMAEYARNILNVKFAATVSPAGEMETVTAAFAQRFTALKGRITRSAIIGDEQTDFQETLASLGNAKFVFAPLFDPQSTLFAQQARPAFQLGMTDGIFTEEIANIDGVYGTIQNADGYGAAWENQFVPAFIAKYGDTLGPYTASSADATNVLLNAAASVAVVTPVGGGTKVSIGRSALRNAVLATQNYRGYSARLTCTALGDCVPNPRVDILRSGGGDFVPVFVDSPRSPRHLDPPTRARQAEAEAQEAPVSGRLRGVQ